LQDLWSPALIPAFPLDGGKLVYLVIDKRWGSRVAALIVSALGMAFAGASTLAFFVSRLAGYPIWAPPGFVSNWRAPIRASWERRLEQERR
jgi:Zn-dependent protease